MAKPLFQDIVPPDKRSIKRIPVPARSRKSAEESEKIVPRIDRLEQTPKRSSRKKNRAFLTLVIVILVLAVLVTLVYFLLPKVTGAKITLVPKGRMVTVDAQFTGTSNPNGALPYQIVAYEKEGKITVLATGEESVQTKAAGVIKIFNNFSSSSQKLVGNTRFETPNGKIFRIAQSVIVPGKVGDTPGSVEASVTADGYGVEYNVGLSDFTLPGFKGDPRYSKIFARSKTPIAGGFAGIRKKVDEEKVKASRLQIQQELTATLVKLMQQNVPADYIFLPNAYFVEFESIPNVSQGENVTIGERARFHAVILKRKDFARSLAEKATGTSAPNSDVFGYESLVFTSKVGTTSRPWENSSLSFTLNGTTTLLTTIDTEKLKSELVGKPRKSLNAVLDGYQGVAKAEVVIRPFWKQNFPDTIDEISVEVASSPTSE